MNTLDVNKMKMNPSAELLAAKYLDNCKQVALLKEKHGTDLQILNLCEEHLKEVGHLLNRKPRKVALIWRLLHYVDEQLILVMDAGELAAHGRRILQGLKTAPVPDSVRIDWSLIVNEKIKELDNFLSLPTTKEENSSVAPKNLNAIAQILKNASSIINNCVDDSFWDIWVRKFFALIYGVLLFIIGSYLMISYLTLYWNAEQFCLTIINILLIGAVGGLVSGLITTEQEYMSKGHFWIPTIYYSIVRPLVGAVAAVAVFWMLESRYLIRVEPPLHNCCAELCSVRTKGDSKAGAQGCGPQATALTGISSAKKGTGNQRPESPAMKGDATFANMSANRKEKKEGASLITLETVEGKQIYLYMLLLFFAGFSGDKILKTVSCKINSKLFADAEKTKGS